MLSYIWQLNKTEVFRPVFLLRSATYRNIGPKDVDSKELSNSWKKNGPVNHQMVQCVQGHRQCNVTSALYEKSTGK